MSTRKIVPNGDNEGGLGTADKRFASIYVTAPETGANDSRAVNAKWVQALVAQAKKEALLEAHPVGSYYWSNDSTNPADLFGGTWEALPAGYGLVAQGTATAEDGSTLTFTAGNKYGEFKHQLTVGELPKLAGSFQAYTWGSGSPSGVFSGTTISGTVNANGDGTFKRFNFSVGNNLYHNNIQPSIAAYCWRRTA